MSDDTPTNHSTKKTWFERVGQLFQGELQNRADLVGVIQEANERDLIDQSTSDMINGVLEVSTLRVRDIMIPRAQMVTLEKSLNLNQLAKKIISSSHSRFPVINEDKDHIKGILLAKDLLRFGFDSTLDFKLKDVLRAAVIVPESKRIDKLLHEFRSERYHMAIVVDEFGGVSGLVTIEDILEKIVGEIEDEFDKSDDVLEDVRQVNRLTFSVKALTSIDDFNEKLNCNFSDEEADTLGGLVSHAFGHLPERGESIELNGFSFKVMNANSRRLIQIQVTIPEEQLSAKEAE